MDLWCILLNSKREECEYKITDGGVGGWLLCHCVHTEDEPHARYATTCIGSGGEVMI
jgi:hypothetical protein